MKKDYATGVAPEGDSAVWARISRTSARAPDDAGTGAPPAPRRGERLTLVIPVADVLLRAERLPTSDPEEIAAIAANRMEAESPLEPDEMVFAHEVLETSGDESLVLCAAAPVSACNRALAAATGSDSPSGAALVARVDCAASGLARSLAAAGLSAASGRQPVLAMDGGRAALIVLEDGRPILARAAGAPAAFAQTLRLALMQAEMSCGPERSAAPLLCLATGPEWVAAAQAAASASGRECETPPHEAQIPSAAFGAALRTLEGASGSSQRHGGGGALDLFPAPWSAALDERRYRRTFIACSAAALVAWAALVGALWGWPAALGARQAALQREVDALAPREGAVRQVRERIRLIDRYSDRTFSPLEILREISLALPEGVTLKQMAYEAARRECTVEGESRGSAPAYDFSNRLKSSPLLARNDIVSGPTENRNTGKTNFRIRLSFAAPEDGEGGGAAPGGEAQGGSR